MRSFLQLFENLKSLGKTWQLLDFDSITTHWAFLGRSFVWKAIGTFR